MLSGMVDLVFEEEEVLPSTIDSASPTGLSVAKDKANVDQLTNPGSIEDTLERAKVDDACLTKNNDNDNGHNYNQDGDGAVEDDEVGNSNDNNHNDHHNIFQLSGKKRKRHSLDPLDQDFIPLESCSSTNVESAETKKRPIHAESASSTKPIEFQPGLDGGQASSTFSSLPVSNPQGFGAGGAEKPIMNQRPSYVSKQQNFNISRTIYLGGIPEGATVTDIFNHIKGGGVESLRIIHEKACAFVDFIDEAGALRFWNRCSSNTVNPSRNGRININGKDVKLGWAKPSTISDRVQMAVKNGATRCVYLGGLEGLKTEESTETEQTNNPNETGITAEQMTEELRLEFSRFGPIDTIRVVPERKIAFVHLCSVGNAMEAVTVLSSEPHWSGKRISFGKDRCEEHFSLGAHSHHNKHNVNEERSDNGNSTTNTNSTNGSNVATTTTTTSSTYPVPSPSIDRKKMRPISASIPTNRTIYLGGIPEETTLEDLCNVIRGGMIQSVRLASEKHCAFVTFCGEEGAQNFYNFGQHYGVWVRGVQVKIGWAQPSILPGSVVTALQKGATRTLYLGNFDVGRFAVLNSSSNAKSGGTGFNRGARDDARKALGEEFSKYGPIDAVHILRSNSSNNSSGANHPTNSASGNAGMGSTSTTGHNIVFISFANILDCVKAFEDIRKDSAYAHVKVSYGKDRCNQVPKCIVGGSVNNVNMVNVGYGGNMPLPMIGSGGRNAQNLEMSAPMNMNMVSNNPSAPLLSSHSHPSSSLYYGQHGSAYPGNVGAVATSQANQSYGQSGYQTGAPFAYPNQYGAYSAFPYSTPQFQYYQPGSSVFPSSTGPTPIQSSYSNLHLSPPPPPPPSA